MPPTLQDGAENNLETEMPRGDGEAVPQQEPGTFACPEDNICTC